MTQTCTLIGNAGVLITAKGINFMIDGLYSEEGHPYSLIPSPVKEKIFAGHAPFDSIDYLLFTHIHPDHYDFDHFTKFMENNTVKKVLMPQDDAVEIMAKWSKDIRGWLQNHQVPYHFLQMPEGTSRRFELEPGMTVTAVNTGHLGEELAHHANCIFLLDLDGRRTLVTGDSDVKRDLYEEILDGIEVDTVLVNPLFFQNRTGAALVNEVIKPKQVLIYHMPAPEKDKMNLGRMVVRQQKRYADQPYTITVLSESLQRVEI